ncbi:SAM-dependent methyltransferase [Frankia sp. AgKG'84/4]|uniref:SAM-dependent methyltransferase n=1 Tax=Frankia sp. AgKG'84/4 TaxID=573490 RepID=UPI0027E42766|nr:SAM-dependent methyltransferase [Frankia sp. AgKG'84/4]
MGTGIPTSPNLHEVAQAVVPDARIVYADNDPLVLAHARALLTGNPAGRTAYLDADLRDVDTILGSSEVRDTLDLTQPVALSVFAILHFVPDSDDPYGVIRRLLDALAPGSYLALSHGTADFGSTGSAEGVANYRARGINLQLRDAAELARFFDGLDLVEPGVQALNRWRPESDSALTDDQINMYGAVGRLR